MPDSPWIGSMITAAVSPSTASASAPGVVARDGPEARYERRERRLLRLLRRRRQRAVGAAVEAVLEHDHPSPALALARELDRALDRLRARSS